MLDSKRYVGKFDQAALDQFMAKSDFIERFLLEERDPRTMTAKRFYNEVQSGIVKLHKTTRAGATVALCSETVKRNELCVMICRTNRNITKTVKGDVISVLGRPAKVIHIMRNSFCPRIMNLTAKHPAIELLGVIPLPNCDSCDVTPCPIREAFETPVEDVAVYALTYEKLTSLMMSRSKRAQELVKKLMKAKNVLFDEVQFLEEGSPIAVKIWERKSHEYILKLDKYDKLADSSPLMNKFLEKAREVITNLQPEVEKLKAKSAIDRHLKHLASSVKTPAYLRALEKQREYNEKWQRKREELQRLHPDKSWIEIEEIIGDYSNVMREFAEESEGLLFSQIVAVQELLIEAIMEPGKYGLTVDDIVTLSRLLFIINANVLVVSYVKGLEGEQIAVQSENSVMFTALRSFLYKLLRESVNKRRVVFTTATFGTLKIENLLNLPDVSNYIWGDPLNTSSKFLVVTDKSRISPYNFAKKLERIKALIKAVRERFGPENVQVCTMNKAWAGRLLKELQPFGFADADITWYGSDLTEGVASKKRIWIMIGLAEKPVNAKDHVAIMQAPYHNNPLNLQGEEHLYYVSQKLRADSVHISTYQAISRAKDPEARDRSMAIIIGARKEDVEKCLLWGPARNLKPVKTEKGLKFEVEIENPISKPLITVAPLSTNMEESLHVIDQWIRYGKVFEYKLNWIHIKKIVDARGYLSVKRLVKAYGLAEDEVKEFLNGLPELFASQSISDYVLVHDSQGAIKAVATKQYYGKQGKPSIYISTRFSPFSIGQASADWFIALKSAVDRAPKELDVLSPRYISHHVSSSVYNHLGEFLDALQSFPDLCPGWIVVGAKGEQREGRRLIRDLHCLSAWSPTFPRRACKSQFWANNMDDLQRYALGPASRSDFFVSVYAFPDHAHPSEGGNPPIDTLFTDLDLESENFSQLRRAWEDGSETVLPELLALRQTLLSDVLHQAQILVNYLTKHDIQPRVLLSGFKGVHVFVDFQPVQFPSLTMAKHILSKFMDELKAETDVAFDPTVIGDVSRLCRIPNTLHSDASKLLGRPQYAVPVTVEELVNLTPKGYDQLCSAPRFIPMARRESNEVLVMLTRITEDMDLDDVAVNPTSSVKDFERLEVYELECTKEILVDEDFDELDVRPCFTRVRRERISLDGPGGHLMRIGAVMELAIQELSVSSIVRWFSFCSDYDPVKTEEAVKDIISRGYADKRVDEYGKEHRRGLLCKKIQHCGFCLRDDCPTFRKKFERR